MSCVPVTPEMAELLEALQACPDVDLEALRGRSEWEQAREWGWVMESGELTGTGLAHVGELPRGIVSEQGVILHRQLLSSPVSEDMGEERRRRSASLLFDSSDLASAGSDPSMKPAV